MSDHNRAPKSVFDQVLVRLRHRRGSRNRSRRGRRRFVFAERRQLFFFLDHGRNSGRPVCRSRQDVAGKFIRIRWRIEIAFVVSVITTVFAATRTEMIVQGAAPIWLAHSSQITARIVQAIEIEMGIIQIVDQIRITVEERTTLATGGQHHDDCGDCNPIAIHRELTFHLHTSSSHRPVDRIGLNGFDGGNRDESERQQAHRTRLPAKINPFLEA